MNTHSRLLTHVVVAASLLLACDVLPSIAEGREFAVKLKDGRWLRGELLSVRPSELLLCPNNDLTEEDLYRYPEVITHVPMENIDSIFSEGQSHVLTGLLIGTGVGLGSALVTMGVASSEAEKDPDPRTRIGFALGAGLAGATIWVGGMIVGTIVGIATSSADIEYPEKDEGIDFEDLKSNARYSDAEPSFLRKL